MAKKRKKEATLNRPHLADMGLFSHKNSLNDAVDSSIKARNIMSHEITPQNKYKKLFSQNTIVSLQPEKARKMKLPAPKTPAQKKVMLAVRNRNFALLEASTFNLNPDDVNTSDCLGNTPLHHAAKAGHFGMCNVLMEKGAVIDLAGQDGNTPLHLAYLSGSVDVNML